MDRAPDAVTTPQRSAALPALSLERAASVWLGRIATDAPELDARWASLDHTTRAALAQLTGGVSPVSIAAAYADWAMHLVLAPGKQVQLAEKALRKAMYAKAPRLARLASAGGEDVSGVEKLATAGGAMTGEPFGAAVADFYLTNPIARASAIMAELSAIKHSIAARPVAAE